jgi:hypothetical protein
MHEQSVCEMAASKCSNLTVETEETLRSVNVRNRLHAKLVLYRDTVTLSVSPCRR